MRARYRFIRTHNHVTQCAEVAIVAAPTREWRVTFDTAIAKSTLEEYTRAIRDGVAAAVKAHQGRRRGQQYHLHVEDVQEAPLYTAEASMRCCAAVAAWMALGNEEREVAITHQEGRWQVRFPDA